MQIEMTEKAREMILSIVKEEDRTGDGLRVAAQQGRASGVI